MSVTGLKYSNNSDSLSSTPIGVSGMMFSVFIIAQPFYASWTLYILNEIVAYRSRLRNLNYRGRARETDELLYKYKGEYYKFILMLFIIVNESLSIIPSIGSTIMQQIFKHSHDIELYEFQIPNVIDALSYVLFYILLFLLNTLTMHMTHFLRLEFRGEQFTPIKKRLVWLAFLLHIFAIIQLAMRDTGSTVVRIVALSIGSIEYVYLGKNSRILYHFLRCHSQDLLFEDNHRMYYTQLRTTRRYKWLTIIIMTSLLLIIIASWISFVTYLIGFKNNYSSSALHPNQSRLLSLLSLVMNWTELVLAFLGLFPLYFIIVLFSLCYLAAACWNRVGPLLGRRRVRFTIREPLLQD